MDNQQDFDGSMKKVHIALFSAALLIAACERQPARPDSPESGLDEHRLQIPSQPGHRPLRQQQHHAGPATLVTLQEAIGPVSAMEKS